MLTALNIFMIKQKQNEELVWRLLRERRKLAYDRIMHRPACAVITAARILLSEM